jgi:hypothetical protein
MSAFPIESAAIRLRQMARMAGAAVRGDVEGFTGGKPLLVAVIDYIGLTLVAEREFPEVVALFPNIEEAFKSSIGVYEYRALIDASLQADPELAAMIFSREPAEEREELPAAFAEFIEELDLSPLDTPPAVPAPVYREGDKVLYYHRDSKTWREGVITWYSRACDTYSVRITLPSGKARAIGSVTLKRLKPIE